MAGGARKTKGLGRNPRTLRGSCVCGAVAYEVADEFRYCLNCHCSDCRKATGSAFKPFAGIERIKLVMTKGEGKRRLFGDDKGHDVRFRICGSFLFSVVREGAYVHVTLGSLVDAPSVRPTAHIFVSEKAPWYEIRDDLPQFSGHATRKDSHQRKG